MKHHFQPIKFSLIICLLFVSHLNANNSYSKEGFYYKIYSAYLHQLEIQCHKQIFHSEQSNYSKPSVSVATINTNMMGCSALLANLNASGTVPDPTLAYVDTSPPFGCGSETMYPSPLVSAEQSGSFSSAFCVPTPLPYRGLDESFQIVIGGDLIIPSTGGAEIEGRAAIGGNIQVDRIPYGIAESGGGTYVIGAAGDAVGVGGTVSGTGALSLGANNVGATYNIVSGGANTATLNNGTKVQNSASLPLDVSAIMADVTCLSTNLSNATATGSFNTTTESFNGSMNPTLEIMTVDGADLNPGTAFNSGYSNVDYGATLVVNVSGTTVDVNYTIRAGRVDDPTFVAFGGGPLIYNVIWNFYEATDITLHTNFQGTIIAPLANVELLGNHNGRMYIGGNLTHSGAGTEIHNYPFTGNLSAYCTSCSTCTNPTADAPTTVQGTCAGATANNNATITLSNITNADIAGIVAGADYSSGVAYNADASTDAALEAVAATTVTFSGLMHNTQYTVRVFNAANDCFTDFVVTSAAGLCISDFCSGNDLNLSCGAGNCPSPYPDIGAYPIVQGRDNNYAVFIGGDLNITGGKELEGKGFVYGDFNFNSPANSYNVGYVGLGSGVVPDSNTVWLTIGGDLNFDGISLIAAGDAVGDAGEGIVLVKGAADPSDFSAGNGELVNSPALDLSTFDACFTSINTQSQCWATQASSTNGTYTDDGFGTFTFTSTDGASGLYVFNIADDMGAGLAFSGSVDFQNFPNDATILINVNKSGSSDNITLNIGSFTNLSDELRQRIMWNFPDAATVTIEGGSQFFGSIVIPSRTSLLDFQNVPGFNGRLIAGGDVNQVLAGSEFHNYSFEGDLSALSCAASCTSPTADTPTSSQGTCTGTTANNDASISIGNIMNADIAGIVAGADYTSGVAYNADASTDAALYDATGGTVTFTGLMHNTQYTIRLFNGANDCFTDIVVASSVIVCGTTNATCPENTAPSGNITASSDAFDDVVGAEIDGNTTGDIHHSASETDPWWEIDLGSSLPVEEVAIYLRTTQLSRFNNAIIEIRDAANTVLSSQTVATPAAVNTLNFAGVSGQKIHIRLEGAGRILEFYEVEVNTNTGDCPLIVNAIGSSCTNGVIGDDGSLVINSLINSEDRVAYSLGSTFTGDPDYANAAVIGALPYTVLSPIMNPSGSQDYTLRIFNCSTANFTDVTVTLTSVDCSNICNCTENVYLNERTGGGSVHKYEVNPDGSLTEVNAANSWYPNGGTSELTNPHGLGVDLNGNVYIGETNTGDIRKLSCGGDLLPESEFVINAGGQNFGTIGNILYVSATTETPDGIYAYDMCTGDPMGYVTLNESITSSSIANWGFHIDENGTFYSTNSLSNGTLVNRLWKFTPTLADFMNNTAYDPFLGSADLPPNELWGIVTDEFSNMYIVQGESIGGVANSAIYKYDASGNFIAATPIDNIEGDGGYNNAIGITYGESSGMLYVSNATPGDDCISIIDPNTMTYVGPGVGAVPSANNLPKGIGIVTECCPTSPNIVVDTLLCSATIGTQIFLQDLIDCSGTFCEGDWTEVTNTGFTFDACDNSITLTQTAACGSFSLSSDGTQPSNRCGAFSITVNVGVENITAPVIAGDQSICNGADPAAFTVTTAATGSNTITYQWQSEMC